jgi:hypothetical protein
MNVNVAETHVPFREPCPHGAANPTSRLYLGRRVTMKLRGLDLAAVILIVIGGLNWGLVGLFEFDLVAAIFGPMSVLARIVYILVGIAALYAAIRSPHLAHLREPHAERRTQTHSA